MDIKAYIREVRAESWARAQVHPHFVWPLRLIGLIIGLTLFGIANEVSHLVASQPQLDQEGLKNLIESSW